MTKSCDLKGQQKLFFLHLDQATSCCRANPIGLDHNLPLSHYLEHWQSEHQQLAQGIEVESCQHCWQDEHRGATSYRQRLGHVNTDHVEIFASNLCNQMCSYCSPKFSSQWQDSIEQQGKFQDISATANSNLEIALGNNKTDYWIDQLAQYLSRCSDNSVSVKLLGGEPLMQKQNLQQLLELNSERVSKLVINTNLNPPSNRFLNWVLEQFPWDKLQFEISLDASPEYNAVPRAGFDCNRFYHNLELLKQHQIDFVFLSVVSVLSVFDIENFQSWLETNQYTARFFGLNNPDCLDPKYLPNEVKESLWKDSLPNVVKESLVQSNTTVDLKLFEQYNYLKQYFDRTNVDCMQNAKFASYWNWLTERYK